MEYRASIREDKSVVITIDGIFATNGRLDRVSLEQGTVHIIDAPAPLGEFIYDALDNLLESAIANGENSVILVVEDDG